MFQNNIKKDYTDEEIIKIVLAIGSEDWRKGINGELIFQTVCHNQNGGGSYKLYYYPDSHLFHCYTDCGDSFDVYELICRNHKCSFGEALGFINTLLGLSHSRPAGFVAAPNTFTDDWAILTKYARQEKIFQTYEPVFYPSTLVDYYFQIYPVEWEAEGILPSSIDKYQIRYDLTNNKIIIPHFDPEGRLIGIRGRALNLIDIENKRKYMPVVLENKLLAHPTAYNLYGLYLNRLAIQRTQKVMIFEAEKSVLKCDGFYGSNNFTVATCGSNISRYQRDLILNLGVKEVFLAFDKEYHEPFTLESDLYSEKILNLAYKFCPYVTTYVLWDVDGLLRFKDSPCDQGQQTLEHLMKHKYEVLTKEET